MAKLTKKKAAGILEMVKGHVREAEQNAVDRKDTWLERMAFYRGLHYTVSDGGETIEIHDISNEAAEVHNYIPAFVRSATASRIRHFPIPQVPAVDGDHRSMAKAKATERLLKSFVDDGVISGEEFVRALYSSNILGGAWLKIHWDAFAGRPVEAEAETEDVLVENEEGELDIETVEKDLPEDPFGAPINFDAFEGEIKVSFVDLFDGWGDPFASCPQEMRYWVHRKVRPTSELRALFPVDFFGEEITWEASTDDIHVAKRSVMSETHLDNFHTTERGTSSDSVTKYYEYWGKPNEAFPNGMLVVYTKDTILHMGPCPYAPARLPVVFLPGDNINPSGMYPDGVVEHLIPLQKTLNRAETKAREIMNTMLHPYILCPISSNVKVDHFNEIGCNVIYYNNGFPPHILHSPEVPSSIFNISQQVVERMKETSTYTLTNADLPKGLESGRAVAFLQEMETNLRSADVKLYKEAVVEAMRQCVQLARQKYKDGRMVRTLNEDSWSLEPFKAADYDMNVDLVIEAFSGAPNSRALRWQETMEAYINGIFNDENPGAKEVRKRLELDHDNISTVDVNAQHRVLAKMENMQILAMSSGDYPGPVNPVREFHDDEMHLDEHNRLRNSPDYLDLSPEARAALDQHCEEHEELLGGKMQAFAQDQQLLNPPNTGTPPSAPGQASPANGGAPTGEPIGPSVETAFNSGNLPS